MEVNSVTARIGDKTAAEPATVYVGGNLTIDAHIDDRPNVIVGSSVMVPTTSTTPASQNTFAGSVAVAIGLYTNTATAFIEAGSAVDAGATLSVTSEALNDYEHH